MRSGPSIPRHADVVVIGGGHNGLVAATYLAKAGVDVVVLEQADEVGGATVSAESFPGVPARLSRYSYLVSLVPEQIRRDLGLNIELIRRRISSYTPMPGSTHGLLIDTGDPTRTRESFGAVGANADAERWGEFYSDTGRLAKALFPTVLDPLTTRSEMKHLVDEVADTALWGTFVETPIEEVVNEFFGHDLVRGVVLTDSLIGTFPQYSGDPATSVCFLYHVIGGGTGDWDVPRGGMGAVSGALARAAASSGVTILTRARVDAVDPDGVVDIDVEGKSHSISARVVVSAVARSELARLVNPSQQLEVVGGAQVKVNLVLNRLPKLRDGNVLPEDAFAGTFHVNEMASQLRASIAQAQEGSIPAVIPCETYCHSLTDSSILDDSLVTSGAHTLTVFALNVPHALIAREDPDTVRAHLQSRVLESINSVLAEPLEDCLMSDAEGRACIETKTTIDLEHSLGLPGGNIFHEPLRWPFAEDDEPLDTPARRWGVESDWPSIVIAGSSARRGGAVSGIAGHNAAMATLEMLGKL